MTGMDDALAGIGCFGFAIAVIFALYPLIALGRIWHYSKQQVDLLTEIRDVLQQPR